MYRKTSRTSSLKNGTDEILNNLREHESESMLIIYNNSLPAFDILCDPNFVIEFIQSKTIGVELKIKGKNSLSEEDNQIFFETYRNLRRMFLIVLKFVDSKKIIFYWSMNNRREILMLEVDMNDEKIGNFLKSFIQVEIENGRSGES